MSEEFNNIFFGLGSTVGRLRMSEGGLGWKPAGGEGKTITEVADNFKSFTWTRVARNFQLRIKLRNRNDRGEERMTFDGFMREDADRVAETIKTFYNQSIEVRELSTKGYNWGTAEIGADDVAFIVKEKVAFEVPLSHVANSNIAGKTEVSMEFVNPEQQQPTTNSGAATNGHSKSKPERGDQLVEMRFYVPGTADKEGDRSDAEGEEEQTAASAFHDELKAKADIGQMSGDGILLFKDVLVLTPRGRYDIDMFSTFLRLRGKTYDYKVLYSSIVRLFLLPKPDDIHVQFVVGLEPAIRQGQTKYPYLVLQFPREEEMDAELNLDEETIQTKYDGKLKKRYEEPTFKIVTNLFKVLSGQKLVVPTTFESSTGQTCVRCNVKAADGLLYPLEKAMLWVSKQTLYIPHSDVHQVIFSRVGGAVSSSKTFDLRVITKSGPEHHFQSLNREEHEKLNGHFAERKIRIKNEMAEDGALGLQAAAGVLSDEDDEMAGEDDEDSEEDEDFKADSEDDGGSPSEDSGDDDDEGDKSGSAKKASSKNRKASSPGSDADDGDSDASMADSDADSPPAKKKRKA